MVKSNSNEDHIYIRHRPWQTTPLLPLHLCLSLHISSFKTYQLFFYYGQTIIYFLYHPPPKKKSHLQTSKKSIDFEFPYVTSSKLSHHCPDKGVLVFVAEQDEGRAWQGCSHLTGGSAEDQQVRQGRHPLDNSLWCLVSLSLSLTLSGYKLKIFALSCWSKIQSLLRGS